MYNALNSMGVIHYQEGNYDSAFYFYQQAHQLAIIQKNDVWLSDDLTSFGTIFREIGDYNTAINYYRLMLSLIPAKQSKAALMAPMKHRARMEYAELFSLLHQYDSAWHYYNLFDTTRITNKDLRIYLVSTRGNLSAAKGL